MRCPTPCDKQNDISFRQEGDNTCPISRWQAFKTFARPKLTGLGDAVASIAEPIRKAFKIKKCGGCAKRQEMLNHLVPFGQRQNIPTK